MEPTGWTMPLTTIKTRALDKAEVAAHEAHNTHAAARKLTASDPCLNHNDPMYEAVMALRSAAWSLENNRDRFLTLAAFAERQESDQRVLDEVNEGLMNALLTLLPFLQEKAQQGEAWPARYAERAIAEAEGRRPVAVRTAE